MDHEEILGYENKEFDFQRVSYILSVPQNVFNVIVHLSLEIKACVSHIISHIVYYRSHRVRKQECT